MAVVDAVLGGVGSWEASASWCRPCRWPEIGGLEVSEEQVRTSAHAAAAPHNRSHEGTRSQGPSGRRRRLLVPLAAAVSVGAVVIAGASLSRALDGVEPSADKAVPVILAHAPDGTVPSVFGHTRESASALLEDRGLEVRYDEKVSCDPEGRPVGTEPTTGASVEPGETVTVLLSYQGPTTDCAGDLRVPWQFVDFATGRGPSPRFADDVALVVDGVPTGTLPGPDAAGGDWGAGSALSILAQGADEVLRDGDSYRVPQLQVTTGTPPDTWCGVARPREVADREALTLAIVFADRAPQRRCPAQVSLYETDGAIDTVVAWSVGARGHALQPIPRVVGLPVTEARNKVTAAGYPARVEELESCHPRDGVVEQAPDPSKLKQDRRRWYVPVTLVVEVAHTTRDCARLDEAAQTFLRFARGGQAPTWAPEVQQLFGYEPWATVPAAIADDPASWSFCSGVAPAECEVSPLVVAGRSVEVETSEYSDVDHWPEGQYCELIDRGGLPTDLPAEKQQIVLYPAEISSCDDDWSVWLWIDETGKITALNLLVPAGDQ